MADRPTILSQISAAGVRTDMLDRTADVMAIPTLWEKSYLCPCRIRETRQPNPSCRLCRGRGVAYLPAKPLKMIIQSQEKGVINTDLGLLDSGTAIGTPSDREVRVAFRDRITVEGALVSQSFIFDVTNKRIKDGFYMVYDVKEVEFATTMEGQIYEGEDFEVDYKNNLFFPKEHLLGKNISINILTTLRYMVADLLKEHRYAPRRDGKLARLPQKLLLKREDIFVDKEAFSNGVNDEEVTEMIDTKRQPSVDGLNGFFRSSGI